jgi:hypothetical protein
MLLTLSFWTIQFEQTEIIYNAIRHIYIFKYFVFSFYDQLLIECCIHMSAVRKKKQTKIKIDILLLLSSLFRYKIRQYEKYLSCSKNSKRGWFWRTKKMKGERERCIFSFFTLSLLTFASSMFNIGTRSQSYKSTLNRT